MIISTKPNFLHKKTCKLKSRSTLKKLILDFDREKRYLFN